MKLLNVLLLDHAQVTKITAEVKFQNFSTFNKFLKVTLHLFSRSVDRELNPL